MRIDVTVLLIMCHICWLNFHSVAKSFSPTNQMLQWNRRQAMLWLSVFINTHIPVAAFLATFAVAIAKYKLDSVVKYRKFISKLRPPLRRKQICRHCQSGSSQLNWCWWQLPSYGVEIQAIIFRRLNIRAVHIRDRLKAFFDIPV